MKQQLWEKSQKELVVKAIEKAGTQHELANILDVHKQVISRWYNCRVRMSLDIYLAIQQYLKR
jgi:DNA-binding transcriptional regulator YdaS (Cro superfamily)